MHMAGRTSSAVLCGALVALCSAEHSSVAFCMPELRLREASCSLGAVVNADKNKKNLMSMFVKALPGRANQGGDPS